MRSNQFYIFLILSLFMVQISFAQKFITPENYSFEKKEDYKKYGNDIIKCTNWLERTAINEDDRSYTKAVNFLGEWVTGCPYIDFAKNVRIDAAFNDCPQLRLYYLGGWARNAIESGYRSGIVDNSLAGLRSALKVYQSNKSLKRSDSIDDLIKIDKSGKLKEWVTDRL